MQLLTTASVAADDKSSTLPRDTAPIRRAQAQVDAAMSQRQDLSLAVSELTRAEAEYRTATVTSFAY